MRTRCRAGSRSQRRRRCGTELISSELARTLARIAERHPQSASTTLVDALELRGHVDAILRAALAGRSPRCSRSMTARRSPTPCAPSAHPGSTSSSPPPSPRERPARRHPRSTRSAHSPPPPDRCHDVRADRNAGGRAPRLGPAAPTALAAADRPRAWPSRPRRWPSPRSSAQPDPTSKRCSTGASTAPLRRSGGRPRGHRRHATADRCQPS